VTRLRSFVFSFQVKLTAALFAVILAGLFISGLVFVVQTRDERREQALDRVAAASPAIYQQSFNALYSQNPDEDIRETLQELAQQQDTRILLLGADGVVVYDTNDGQLNGTTVDVPDSTFADIERGYIAWPGPEDSATDITLVSAASRFVTPRGNDLPFRIVIAVKSDTIAEAWRGVLPGLFLAAFVAIPLAMLFSIGLARQVARPVRRLTAASEAMAAGDFDQHVPSERDDELGRLARSFTAMSERVSQRDSQMRALLANVSHDLKTPMTSITGYAQALTDGTASAEDVARIGGIIREEAEHVNALIADLLYLAEMDAGEVILKREDVALEPIVERCIRRIEPRARDRHIEIDVESAPEAVARNSDPDKIERALTNVLDNAAKFTPGGGDITVRTWRENGVLPARVVCRVTNTGQPIPDEDLARIFQRFYRGDRARRSSNGSGLGLAISKQLVELSGGRIDAENSPAGPTFTLTFPG
jgi:signal transduction histidine kinase